VAVLAVREWGRQEGGRRDPQPWFPGPPMGGRQDPQPRVPGPPIREGSPTGREGREAVHRPLAAQPLAVLVHGVTSSSRTWWRVGPALTDRGYRVLAVDLRGHGASPRAEAGLSAADLADDVAETVGAVTAGSPGVAAQPPVDLLVGHSLGALVALEVAGRRPGFARRLVAEDPPGSASVDWAALADGVEADTSRAVTAPDALRRDLVAANPAWPPGEAERRVADLADCDGQAIAAAFRSGIRYDLSALLAAVPLLVLLLLAEESIGSTLLGLDRKAAVESLGDGTTRVLPAGHNVHREALDAWLAALDDWLAP
jgi:pimeloyl-ACP methyl ester carboxylesterase